MRRRAAGQCLVSLPGLVLVVMLVAQLEVRLKMGFGLLIRSCGQDIQVGRMGPADQQMVGITHRDGNRLDQVFQSTMGQVFKVVCQIARTIRMQPDLRLECGRQFRHHNGLRGARTFQVRDSLTKAFRLARQR